MKILSNKEYIELNRIIERQNDIIMRQNSLLQRLLIEKGIVGAIDDCSSVDFPNSTKGGF